MRTYPCPCLPGFCLLYQGSHAQWSVAHENRIVTGKICHACSKTLQSIAHNLFENSVKYWEKRYRTIVISKGSDHSEQTFNRVVNGLAIMLREHFSIQLGQEYNPCALPEGANFKLNF